MSDDQPGTRRVPTPRDTQAMPAGGGFERRSQLVPVVRSRTQDIHLAEQVGRGLAVVVLLLVARRDVPPLSA